ncbi:MAG: vWA domain-containing protein, partial [Bdellovibrionota bacterium]
MNIRVYITLLLMFATGLTACDQKVSFRSVAADESVFRRPDCTATVPSLEGSTTVEVSATSDIHYNEATNVFWYILLPDGERIFQGPHLAIAVDQVGSYPAAVWGNDSCGVRRQINFDLVIVPSLKDAFISINNNAQYTRTADVTVQLTAVGASEMYVTQDSSCQAGGVWEAYGPSKNVTLTQENLDAKVFVKFKSSAKETACISDGITYDKTPPELKFVSVPPAVSMQSTAEFELAASDEISGVKDLECSLDGQAFSICANKVVYNNVPYGVHKFETRATDFAGNVTDVKSYEWNYKNNAPTVKILTGPPASTLKTEARFTFIGEDDSGVIDHYECDVDGDEIINCQSPLDLEGMKIGSHVFTVTAYDGTGLASQPATYNWTVNDVPPPPVPPVVRITKAPDQVTFDTLAKFEFTATHSGIGIKSFYCKINNEVAVPCVSPKQYQLMPGTHSFAVYAIDNDNLMSNTATYSWKIDKKRIPYNDSFIVDTSGRKLDVVIVIDNSPSMAEEQQKMAKRFSTFIETLKELDWQLGIITTDAGNGSKAWQDGRLLPFEGLKNTYSINAKTPDVNKVFEKTIRRKEWGTSKEEGIHSLYKAIQRSENKFLFRENSHVASVIVSDEDERSDGSKLKDVNQPTNLV